ncbi:hypothetical protein J2Y69_000937 [Microbacterium resistens]|uniref:Large extracellular alpha-helical protein n=1 Tax=Microbacterium resistens TaxID=156977 RepID=A0ABU1S9R6_9MICO|nr:DUF5719 family protein [Microbacterium resistens]MDR6866345.1 hypothetical protein [Microbacterium resistens]
MTKPTAVRVAATGARLIGGLLVSAACVAGVVVAVPAAIPGIVHEPARTSITPVPGDTLLTCAGPFRALGRDAQNAGQMTVAGAPALTAGAAAGSSIQPSELAIADVADATTAPMYVAPPSDRAVAQAAAASSLTIAADDLSGFAAAACRPASMQSWIVGGAGAAGSNDILLIANPGQVPATVSFTFYGQQGEKRSSDLIVPPKTQRSLPLAAGAAGETSPVVQITSSGSPVRAALQSSLIRTLDPAGIDLQDGIAHAETSQALLGVRVVLPATGEGVSTLVRLLAPSADGTVRLQARNADGGATVGEEKTVSLTAGQPAEVDMSGLKPGFYSIDVTSTTPVVAGAWQTTSLGKGADFAWMTPAPEISSATTFAVAEGPQPQLQVRNAGAVEARVTLTPTGGGTPQQLTVPADGSTIANVTAGTVYTLETDQPVRAALGYLGTGQIAGYPVWPALTTSPEIAVYQ